MRRVMWDTLRPPCITVDTSAVCPDFASIRMVAVVYILGLVLGHCYVCTPGRKFVAFVNDSTCIN